MKLNFAKKTRCCRFVVQKAQNYLFLPQIYTAPFLQSDLMIIEWAVVIKMILDIGY